MLKKGWKIVIYPICIWCHIIYSSKDYFLIKKKNLKNHFEFFTKKEIYFFFVYVYFFLRVGVKSFNLTLPIIVSLIQ